MDGDEARPVQRSVVWIRYPWRPVHAADAVGDDGTGGVSVLGPPGAVRLKSTWELGQVQEVLAGGNLVVQVGTSFPSGSTPKQKTVPESSVYLANPARLDGVSDMCRLSELSIPCLLHNLAVRFRSGAIYTSTGPLLISVNPFHPIPELYDEAAMQQYRAQPLDAVAPHVYAVAEGARQALLRDQSSQSIVISGESGAGKTEAAKYIMGYLTSASTGPGKEASGGVEGVIQRSNPITEAFGNAKTARNDNSSRFGKFLKMTMDRSGKIKSGHMDHYLLEKSRVTHQATDERNYHVLYQLCCGADEELRGRLHLRSVGEHRFTSQSECMAVENVDDAAEFGVTVEALRGVGVSKGEEDSVLSALAGVLHLGDLEFGASKDGNSTIEEGMEAKACQVLGLAAQAARDALCFRKIKAGLETLSVPKSKMEALASRDAVARSLYTKLFDWLIAKVNTALHASQQGQGVSDSDVFIGLLDIFGFEIMQENGFEQLCINYANEKLQRFFNEHMLASEQEEYKAEGVDWAHVEYVDNFGILDLMEGKPEGILPILDDQCMLATATDQAFLQILSEKQGGGAHFSQPKLRHTSFTVRHSAGNVEYEVEGFLDKNKDQLFSDLTDMVAASSNALIRGLFASTAAPAAGSGKGGPPKGKAAGGKAAQHISVSAKFRDQLTALMKTLSRTKPTFVRCIKPNPEKRPRTLHAELIEHQLRCSGVLAAVRISQSGYPSRVSYWECAQRYRPLTGQGAPRGQEEARRQCEVLVERMGVAAGRLQFGRTKLFLKGGVLARLEEELSHALTDRAACLQACFRRRWTTQLAAMRAAAAAAQGAARRAKARGAYCAEVARALAAARIGGACRRCCARAALGARHGAATRLQKVVRGRQTRLKVEDAKQRQRAMMERMQQQQQRGSISSQSSAAPSTAPSDGDAFGNAHGVQPGHGHVPPAVPKRHGSQLGPSLVGIMGETADVGVQTQAGGEGVQLGSGRWLFADDIKMEALLRDNEQLFEDNKKLTDEKHSLEVENSKMQAFARAQKLGAASPLVLQHPLGSMLSQAAPGAREVNGQVIFESIRKQFDQLEGVFEEARVGLRQIDHLNEALKELGDLRKEVAALRGEREVWEGMKSLVQMQEKNKTRRIFA